MPGHKSYTTSTRLDIDKKRYGLKRETYFRVLKLVFNVFEVVQCPGHKSYTTSTRLEIDNKKIRSQTRDILESVSSLFSTFLRLCNAPATNHTQPLYDLK